MSEKYERPGSPYNTAVPSWSSPPNPSGPFGTIRQGIPDSYNGYRGVFGLLHQYQKYASTQQTIKDVVAWNYNRRNIERIRDQLQPGQGVDVYGRLENDGVFDPIGLTPGGMGASIGPAGTRINRIEKPGRGEYLCEIPDQIKEVTTEFQVKNKEGQDVILRLNERLLQPNERPSDKKDKDLSLSTKYRTQMTNMP